MADSCPNPKDKAFADAFKMISPQEARVRQGIGLVLLSAGLYSGGVILNSAGVMLVNMGRLSQWGCIVRLRWNPEGTGRRTIPPHLDTFARAKRREFFINMVVSASVGVAVTHVANYYLLGDAGSFAAAAILRSVQWMAAALALTVGFSALF